MTPDVIGVIIAMFSAVALVSAGMYALLQRMQGHLDVRFERVDAQFERIDARFERVDDRLERIEAKFEVKLGELEAKIGDKLDSLEVRMNARFERLESKVDDIALDVTALKARVARLEGPPPRMLS